MKVLITGGAGYIGSHIVVELVAAGHQPVVVDDFSNANPKVLDRLKQLTGKTITCHRADVLDRSALARIFKQEKPEAVIHLAGFKAVGESVADPLKYYRNNVFSTVVLAEVMREAGVKCIVFSSTATVYGKSVPNPVTEEGDLNPQSPYAQSKLMSEIVLRDLAVTDPEWSVGLLRYFNPVGAHPSGVIGEDSGDAPNNLMPFVAKVAVGRQSKVKIYGHDYHTPDGTGRRDYLHVVDLAKAHVLTLAKLGKQTGTIVYNFGTGKPCSVLEVIAAFEAAAGHPIPYEFEPRRGGDIDEYWASPAKAQAELGWKAERTLLDMCADMWQWQSRNPAGYDTP